MAKAVQNKSQIDINQSFSYGIDLDKAAPLFLPSHQYLSQAARLKAKDILTQILPILTHCEEPCANISFESDEVYSRFMTALFVTANVLKSALTNSDPDPRYLENIITIVYHTIDEFKHSVIAGNPGIRVSFLSNMVNVKLNATNNDPIRIESLAQGFRQGLNAKKTIDSTSEQSLTGIVVEMVKFLHASITSLIQNILATKK